MRQRLVWDDHGHAQLRRLNPLARRSVRQALRDFESLWTQHTKPLRGYPDMYTATVGAYRVILIETNVEERCRIVLIAHRSVAYDDYPLIDTADD